MVLVSSVDSDILGKLKHNMSTVDLALAHVDDEVSGGAFIGEETVLVEHHVHRHCSLCEAAIHKLLGLHRSSVLSEGSRRLLNDEQLTVLKIGVIEVVDNSFNVIRDLCPRLCPNVLSRPHDICWEVQRQVKLEGDLVISWLKWSLKGHSSSRKVDNMALVLDVNRFRPASFSRACCHPLPKARRLCSLDVDSQGSSLHWRSHSDVDLSQHLVAGIIIGLMCLHIHIPEGKLSTWINL